jgi:hypothetical protein
VGVAARAPRSGHPFHRPCRFDALASRGCDSHPCSPRRRGPSTSRDIVSAVALEKAPGGIGVPEGNRTPDPRFRKRGRR